MNNNKRIFMWMMLFSFLVASCSVLSGAAGNDLDGTKWNLLFIRKSVPLSGKTITMEFKDGEVRGSSGCNSYFGEYVIKGSDISFGNLAATAMACLDPDGAMKQEQEYLTFLSEVVAYSVEGDRLILKKAHQDQLTFQKVSDN